MKNPERRQPFSNGWTQKIAELEAKVETLEREKNSWKTVVENILLRSPEACEVVEQALERIKEEANG